MFLVRSELSRYPMHGRHVEYLSELSWIYSQCPMFASCALILGLPRWTLCIRVFIWYFLVIDALIIKTLNRIISGLFLLIYLSSNWVVELQLNISSLFMSIFEVLFNWIRYCFRFSCHADIWFPKCFHSSVDRLKNCKLQMKVDCGVGTALLTIQPKIAFCKQMLSLLICICPTANNF